MKTYEYNYNYVPPLAMIDKVPGVGFTAGWAFLVVRQSLKILINALAVHGAKDLSKLSQELDALLDEFQEFDLSDLLKLPKLLILLGKVALELPADLKSTPILGKLVNDIIQNLNHEHGFSRDLLNNFASFINQALMKVAAPTGDALQPYRDLFKTLPLPAIANTFEDDQTFADMRVAGPNPMTIQRLSTLKPDYAITNEQFQATLGSQDDLSQAIQENRVYVVDYLALGSVLMGAYPEWQKYLEPIAAFFALPKGNSRLRVFAIQQGQGANSQVYTPAPSTQPEAWNLWMRAKAAFTASDGTYHEAVSHLGQTHLVVEPFVIATMNQLSPQHALRQLLMPHFEGTLFINNAAQAFLVSTEGQVNTLLAPAITQAKATAAQGTRAVLLQFNQSFLAEDLKRRGVDSIQDLPYYPYRDGAIVLWEAIHQWIKDYIEITYPNDQAMQNDQELQGWMEELQSMQGGRVQDIGEEGQLKTRAYLARLLTQVIFTGSAQHAAVNFPQLSLMSYLPAMPLAQYQPLSSPGHWTNLLAPTSVALTQINVLYLLGGVYYTQLGQYGKHYFKNPAIQNALSQFQENLKNIEATMKAADPQGTYPYLWPSRIPQSINI